MFFGFGIFFLFCKYLLNLCLDSSIFWIQFSLFMNYFTKVKNRVDEDYNPCMWSASSDLAAYFFVNNKDSDEPKHPHQIARSWFICWLFFDESPRKSRCTKTTLWAMRNASSPISMCSPQIFCFRNRYSSPISPWDGMCRTGLACADSACWSGSIQYVESKCKTR